MGNAGFAGERPGRDDAVRGMLHRLQEFVSGRKNHMRRLDHRPVAPGKHHAATHFERVRDFEAFNEFGAMSNGILQKASGQLRRIGGSGIMREDRGTPVDAELRGERLFVEIVRVNSGLGAQCRFALESAVAEHIA